MQIVFSISREVVVDNDRYLLHVNATCEEVSDDENTTGPRSEFVHDLAPMGRIQRTMKLSRVMRSVRVPQSTFRHELQKMTTWVMFTLSLSGHRVEGGGPAEDLSYERVLRVLKDAKSETKKAKRARQRAEPKVQLLSS